MRSPYLADDDLEARVTTNERAGGTRVIRVDMSQEQCADIGQRHPAFRESRLERADAHRWAAVHERGLRTVEEIDPDDVRTPEVEEIDEGGHAKGVRRPPCGRLP